MKALLCRFGSTVRFILVSIIACLLFVGNALSYEIKVYNGADCLVEVNIQFISSEHDQHYTLGVDEEITFGTSHRCPREITAKIYAKNHTYSLRRCLHTYHDGSCEIACFDSRWKVVKSGEEQYDLIKEE